MIRINILSNNGGLFIIVKETDNYESIINLIKKNCKNKIGVKVDKIVLINGSEFTDVAQLVNNITLCIGNNFDRSNISQSVIKNDPTVVSDATIRIVGEEFSNSETLESLKTIAKKEGVIDILALPDLSTAVPCPVGTSITTVGKIYPSWIGPDIGCGVTLFKVGCKLNRIDRLKQKIAKDFTDKWDLDLAREFRTKFIPNGLINLDKHDENMGSIGHGNHFCELQKDENDDLFICVHSGSRTLGMEIHEISSDANFMEYQEIGIKWARCNRLAIATRFMEFIGSGDLEKVVCLCHNFIEKVNDTYVHRKGAIPADKGPAMIPGSRGSSSYLVESIGSLNSLPHGAGRKYTKSDSEKKFANSEESTVICNDKKMFAQEAPGAYKNLDSIMTHLVENDIIRIISVFSPILTLKYTGN